MMSDVEHIGARLLRFRARATKLDSLILLSQVLLVDLDKVRVTIIWPIDFIVREGQVDLFE